MVLISLSLIRFYPPVKLPDIGNLPAPFRQGGLWLVRLTYYSKFLFIAVFWRRSRPWPPRFEGAVSVADRGSVLLTIGNSLRLRLRRSHLPHNEGGKALCADKVNSCLSNYRRGVLDYPLHTPTNQSIHHTCANA